MLNCSKYIATYVFIWLQSNLWKHKCIFVFPILFDTEMMQVPEVEHFHGRKRPINLAEPNEKAADKLAMPLDRASVAMESTLIHLKYSGLSTWELFC